MEFLSEYGMFLAKTVTFVVAIVVVIGFALAAGMKGQHKDKGKIVVERLNDYFDDLAHALQCAALDEKALKQLEKDKKKSLKEEQKEKDKATKNGEPVPKKKRVFVLDFDGDIKASATEDLRESITAVLSLAEAQDEVVVKLESAGGMVHSYGLAASQLNRITSKKIPLTVCVDKVAASGGYMMACVADKILAAPFAIIGSIGVVAQIPNVHKLLKKHDVEYDVLTAGEYKRTLTVFGENTEKGRQKFIEDLEDTHVLFKDFIRSHRESVDVEAVATGEIWFGTRALENKLIDGISTSDEYLTGFHNEADIFAVSFEHKKSLQEKLGLAASGGIETAITRVLSKFNFRYWA